MAPRPWNLGPGLVDFSPLGRLGETFTSSYDRARKSAQADAERLEFGQIGKSMADGSIDYSKAAGRVAGLGRLDSAIDLLKLGEGARNRTAGEAASRGLMDAIGGGGGSPVPTTPTGNGVLGELGSPQPSLVASESGGRWDAQNDATGAGGVKGHFGRLQFGQARLQEAAAAGAIPPGITPQQFMASPEIQQRAERWHFNDIDQAIKANGYDQMVGRAAIGGVPITVEGLRAVAHLGGKEGMRKFVETNGAYDPPDRNGTRLSDYFARHGGGGQRTQVAQGNPDLPAPGARQASMARNGTGFSVPGQTSMSGRTFDAVTAGEPPLQPVFQSEGASQPWMGSALQRQPQSAQVARPASPPSRPYNVGADVPAPMAAQAMGQLPRSGPGPTDLSNANDAGAKDFAMMQGANGSNALANAFLPPVPPTSVDPRADLPAPGAVTTQGRAVPSAEMPRPTNREEWRDVVQTRQMEGAKGQIGKLATALANPNLPANARAVGEIFLRDALDASKAPDSVKEFLWARSTGMTTANGPAEYAKEKSKTSPVEEVQGRKDAAAAAGLKPGDPRYETYVLTGKTPREDAQPLTATDKKAIMEADDGVMAAETAISALKDAKKLSPQALSGFGAGARATAANNLPDWMVPDGVASKAAGQASAELENVVTSQALAQLKSIFGSAPTEGERKILLDIQGSLGQPDSVRQAIYDRGIALAERRLGYNKQRRDELRGGDFYKPEGKRGQGGNQAGAPTSVRQSQPDASQAKRAPDGNYYLPDPARPGKFLMVQP